MILHPCEHARTRPDQPALIMASSGAITTYQQLEERSNQGAHLFRQCSLKKGDHIALLMENNTCFFEICWAAQRAGLYYTPISTYLQPDEIEYIINNCGAEVVISSNQKVEKIVTVKDKLSSVKHFYHVNSDDTDKRELVSGFKSWDSVIHSMPIIPISDESEGREMLYSSGTTGRPKGIKFTQPEGGLGEAEEITRGVMLAQFMGVTHKTVALSTAPSYHSAPLGFVMGAHRLGCTVVLMEKFDAEQSLQLIEKYQVGYSQWVPTMFIRLIKLPEEIRKRYDVSSMQMAIHGSAPCPVHVKEQIIDWWGPILWEFYSGSERNGIFMISSEDWLEHKGSVGKCVDAQVHIVNDETKEERPTGEIGTVYCSKGGNFEYYGDEEKTQSVAIRDNWTTIGDVGYLDNEGYLYLTDRKSYMIISGGVNIYPQETEDCLIQHPKVADVAVFGVPHSEMGESVKAVVQAEEHVEAGSRLESELEAELIAYCRSRMSAIKCPKSIDFEEHLPREETGKLKKRLIKDRYWL